MLNVLAKYERATWQQINRAKTTLFFSKSTSNDTQLAIKEMLGVPVVHQYEKYLGLPSLVGRNKKESFTYIKQRVWKKIQGWEAKLLSQVGREILIKAVAQALPTYNMACFKLPATLCPEIEMMICRFFWGQKGDNRKVHWVKWQDLCKPKSQGGMGFKNLSLFNDALLAKHTWRLLHDTNPLFYCVFKAKFFPNSTMMEAKIPANASYAWRSIMRGRDVIKRGSRWRIGSGDSIHIWGDNWLPIKAIPKLLSPFIEDSTITFVRDLIDQEQKVWREDVLENSFYPFEVSIIKNIPLCRTIQEDVLIWPFNPDGTYIVKSGYKFLYEEHLGRQPGPSENEALKPLWKKIWGLNVPNKVKHLAWRACKDSLPTKLNLVRWKIITTGTCDRRKTHQEDAVHALLLCSELKPLWCTRPEWNHGTLHACSSFIDVFDFIFAGNKESELFAAVIWTIWNRCNNLRLGKPALPLDKVLEFTQERLTGIEATNERSSHPHGRATNHWTAPDANGFKINFDGAIFADRDRAGIGVVIRNDAGMIMASLTQQIPLPTSVIEVEALAARRALELGFDDIILEGDSELLIKNLKNGDGKLTTTVT